ncbi:GDP-L-galactose phosphorylase 1 [Actinidia rufa]|uniref:GDP-L-galactose phosphorylase 1 n=1 Tax=Actinidia rufa TaxID=165716 RepID=A0A7J0H5M8_9ERIC|nr:GDP-L-galactose phosphorylase 1 [Actinidia rufa]
MVKIDFTLNKRPYLSLSLSHSLSRSQVSFPQFRLSLSSHTLSKIGSEAPTASSTPTPFDADPQEAEEDSTHGVNKFEQIKCQATRKLLEEQLKKDQPTFLNAIADVEDASDDDSGDDMFGKRLLAVDEEETSVAFLDSLLLREWEDRVQRGLFHYDVTACKTKVFVVSFLFWLFRREYGFIAQLNEGRHIKKRPTEFRVDKEVGFELIRFAVSNGDIKGAYSSIVHDVRDCFGSLSRRGFEVRLPGHHRGKYHGAVHELSDHPMVIQNSYWASLPQRASP